MVQTIKEFFQKIVASIFSFMGTKKPSKTEAAFFIPKRNANWYGITFGINKCDPVVYYGSPQPLNGCVNDSNNIKKSIKTSEWVQYTDKTATIGNAIQSFIDISKKIKEGDVLFLHHSRHGSSLEGDYLTKDEEKDEAAVMYDGFIVDDCFMRMFKTLPKCTVIYINDSCFSESQYKALRLDIDVEELEKISALQITPKVLSSQYKPSKNNILDEGQLAKLIPDEKTLLATIISISGCRDTQTSSDAFLDGKYQGALTWGFLKMLKDNPLIKIADIQSTLRKILKKKGFEQEPVVLIEGDKNITLKSLIEL